MATYYLDDTLGDDANAGTSEGSGNAWKTPAKAADVVAAGDVVYVKNTSDYDVEDGSNGSIMVLSTAGTAGSPIRIIGYSSTPGDGGQATFNAGTAGLANVLEGNIGFYRWENIRFTGASSHGVNAVGNVHTCVNCRFDNHGSVGFYATGKDDFTFIDCMFDNNGSHSTEFRNRGIFIGCDSHDEGGSGFYITGTYYIAIDCKSYGISNNAHIPIVSSSIGIVIIYGCTIDGENTTTRAIYTQSLHTIIMNTVLHDCVEGVDMNVDYRHISHGDYNLYFSNVTDRTNWNVEANVQTTDPDFADEAAHDYTPNTASPLVGNGFDCGPTGNANIGCEQGDSGSASAGNPASVQGPVEIAKDTASQKVPFTLLDKDTVRTYQTGVTSPTIEISKNGGAFGSANDGTFAEISDGRYTVTLDATDTDTEGPLTIRIVKAGETAETHVLCDVVAAAAPDNPIVTQGPLNLHANKDSQSVPVILVEDGNIDSRVTGVTSPTIEISKNGDPFAAASDGTFAEVGNGLYTVTLDRTDTGTLGWLELRVIKSGTTAETHVLCKVAIDAAEEALMAHTVRRLRTERLK